MNFQILGLQAAGQAADPTTWLHIMKYRRGPINESNIDTMWISNIMASCFTLYP